jgi:hypothetical protein
METIIKKMVEDKRKKIERLWRIRREGKFVDYEFNKGEVIE